MLRHRSLGHLGVLAASGPLARTGGVAAEPVGLGAGFDDVRVEGDPVDDGRDQPGVGEHRSPLTERQICGQPDGGPFLPLGDDLEQQFRSSGVDFDLSDLVVEKHNQAAVAADNP